MRFGLDSGIVISNTDDLNPNFTHYTNYANEIPSHGGNKVVVELRGKSSK